MAAVAVLNAKLAGKSNVRGVFFVWFFLKRNLQRTQRKSLAALLASVSGWLFAHFQRSVNPSPFGLKMGIEYLFMAVVGGNGAHPT